MHKIYLLLSLVFLPIGVSALGVDVAATPPSGTYHTPVHIVLTPTDSRAKTFYSFKPDGYPQDAFLYTGPILLKHSSPIIYFSFLSTSDESKIKQNNYIIEYPSTVHFENGSVSGSGKVDVSIINSGSESVNIGFWYVQSESETVTVPEGTMIAPWATYSIHLNYQGTSSVVLRSPDDDERDILVPEDSSGKNETILPKEKTVPVKKVPRKIISIGEIPVENPGIPIAQPSSQATPPVTEKVSDTPSSIRPEATEVRTPVPMDINQMVKVSANESGQKGMNPLYLVLIGALSLGAGIFQWYTRRTQK